MKVSHKIANTLLIAAISLISTHQNQEPKMDNQNTNKATLIVTSTPDMTQQESLQAYVSGVMPMLLKLGGTVIKRSRIESTYHGEATFTHLLVMDFPSKEALVAMFDGAAYQALIPARNKAFSEVNILFADDL